MLTLLNKVNIFPFFFLVEKILPLIFCLFDTRIATVVMYLAFSFDFQNVFYFRFSIVEQMTNSILFNKVLLLCIMMLLSL